MTVLDSIGWKQNISRESVSKMIIEANSFVNKPIDLVPSMKDKSKFLNRFKQYLREIQLMLEQVTVLYLILQYYLLGEFIEC